MKKVSITNLADMDTLAQEFCTRLSPKEDATVVALSGDLGAGKTAFVKSIAKALGIIDHITSPTFVIQKIYPVENGPCKKLVHIDAYRLESARELMNIGWGNTIAEKDTLVMLEWPERVSEVLPADVETLTFEFVNDTTREVTLPDTW